MSQLLTLGGFFSISMGQLALKFHWVKMCFFNTSNITNHIEITTSHVQTSLLVNCAGGSQGVQLLDRSNKGQVWAIRLRWVWGSCYPSIQCWRLWIGKSTYSCEPIFPEIKSATFSGIIQAYILQVLKTLFRSKLQPASLLRIWRMQLCL